MQIEFGGLLTKNMASNKKLKTKKGKVTNTKHNIFFVSIISQVSLAVVQCPLNLNFVKRIASKECLVKKLTLPSGKMHLHVVPL